MRPTAPAVRCTAAGLETRAPPEQYALLQLDRRPRRGHGPRVAQRLVERGSPDPRTRGARPGVRAVLARLAMDRRRMRPTAPAVRCTAAGTEARAPPEQRAASSRPTPSSRAVTTVAGRSVWWSAGLRARGRAERGRACEPCWRDSRWTGVACARRRRRCAAPPRARRPALRRSNTRCFSSTDALVAGSHHGRGSRSVWWSAGLQTRGRAERGRACEPCWRDSRWTGVACARRRRRCAAPPRAGDPRSAGAIRAASSRPTPSSRAVTEQRRAADWKDASVSPASV